MAVIQTTGLSKRYKDRWAVDLSQPRQLWRSFFSPRMGCKAFSGDQLALVTGSTNSIYGGFKLVL